MPIDLMQEPINYLTLLNYRWDPLESVDSPCMVYNAREHFVGHNFFLRNRLDK